MPSGLACAKDNFQRKVNESFSGLVGVTGIANDIIVYGLKSDSGNHDNENLRAVMKRAREIGMKFNPEKSKIRCKSILYFRSAKD